MSAVCQTCGLTGRCGKGWCVGMYSAQQNADAGEFRLRAADAWRQGNADLMQQQMQKRLAAQTEADRRATLRERGALTDLWRNEISGQQDRYAQQIHRHALEAIGVRELPRLHDPEALARLLFATDDRVIAFITRVGELDPARTVDPERHRQRILGIAWDRNEGGWRTEAEARAQAVLDAFRRSP